MSERYLGVPHSGYARYRDASLIRHAEDGKFAKKKLFLIHGTADGKWLIDSNSTV